MRSREARWTETPDSASDSSATSCRCTSDTTTEPQTGQLMSRSSSDLNQIQMFVVMIPITLSNSAMISAVTSFC